MIDLRQIQAWAPYAPWPTQPQVEQDLLITRAMVAIFRDRFLAGQVAMRGGTMLHKLHVAPAARYSEDIDLVAVGERAPGHIRRALLRVLNPVMGGPPKTDVRTELKLAIRNIAKPSKLIRLEWVYAPTGQPRMSMKLKVEVNVTERAPFYQLVRVPFTPSLPEGAASVDVITYDVDEMLGTKMRALLQRDHGRDLFDLAHAWAYCSASGHPHPINAARVVAAFRHYMAQEGADVDRDHYERDLMRKVRLARFRADLSDVLADGVKYDVDAATDIVRREFLTHLP